MSGNGKSGLFGNAEQVAVERGVYEFRSERPVIMTSKNEVAAVLPVDGMTEERLAAFRTLCAPAQPKLVISSRRAKALGIDAAGPVGVAIGDLHTAAAIFALASDTQVTRHVDVVPAGEVADPAIALAKLAQRLPALLIADGRAAAASDRVAGDGGGGRGGALSRGVDRLARGGGRGDHSAQRRHLGPLRDLPGSHRRHADRHRRRPSEFCRAGRRCACIRPA